VFWGGFFKLLARKRRAALPLRQPFHPALELLEDRRLFSIGITEFPVPTSSSNPTSIVAGPDGNLWFTETQGQKIGKITPSGSITEYSLPSGHMPYFITSDGSGNLWFTERQTGSTPENMVGKISIGGSLTEYAVSDMSYAIGGITKGPDGNFWLTEFAIDSGNFTCNVDKITPGGTVTKYVYHTGFGGIGQITAGPDGNLWFTDPADNKLGRITPSGSMTEYAIPTNGSNPAGITVGPDGALWFAENASGVNKVGRITTGGSISEYSLPADAVPNGIVTGPDGNLWFTSSGGTQQVGRLTPSGAVTEYAIPTSYSNPQAITVGPGSTLWFAEQQGDKIGRIDGFVQPTTTTITSSANPSVFGQAVTFTATVSATPPGSGTPTGTVTFFDNGTAMGAGSLNGSGVATFTTSTLSLGTHPITASYAGDSNFTGSTSGTLSQVINNPAPTLTSLSQGSATEGDAGFTLTLTGQNFLSSSTVQENGQTVASTFLSSTQLSVTVAGADLAEEGSRSFTVTNPTPGGGTSNALALTVNDAALHAGTLSAPTPTEGVPINNAVLFHFADANSAGVASDYTGTITWGDGQVSTVTSTATSEGQVVAHSGGGFDVLGSHTYLEEDTGLTFSVSVSDDNSTASASTTFSVADAPLAASWLSLSATAGLPLSGPVANFTDADPNGAAADYSAAITWGDDSAPSMGTITSLGGGSFRVDGSHVFLQGGTYSVQVTVTDAGGSTATASDPAMVRGLSATGTTFSPTEGGLSTAAPQSNLTGVNTPLQATEGVALTNVPVTTFSDANPAAAPGDFAAAIDWGDGTPSTQGTVTGLVSGGFEITGSHSYAQAGTFTVTTTITDNAGGQASTATTTVVVADASLTGTPTSLNATEGTPLNNAVVATFADANPNGAAGDYSATIDWGDGTLTSSGSLSATGGAFSVAGNHTYSQPGSFDIEVTISDAGGGQAVIASLVTVADVSLSAGPLTFAPGAEGSDSSLVATFSDADTTEPATAYTATIDWGDGGTSGSAITGSGGTFSADASHTYESPGTYTVTVTVTIADEAGMSTTDTGSIVVPDAPLSASGATAYATQALTATNLTVATFTDAYGGDAPGHYQATIDWADGTARSSGTVAYSGNGFQVMGTHTYTSVGVYSPTVTIVDDSATATATGTVEVTTMAPTGDSVTADEGWLSRAPWWRLSPTPSPTPIPPLLIGATGLPRRPGR
jgi:streptogramin lyase